MATGRKKGGRPGAQPPPVVRRAPEERKRLPPELEAFARSDDTRLRPPPRGPRLKDPRPAALVPGVSNRDARAVHEARVERLRALAEQGEAGHAQLLQALAEAVMLQLWRGRAVTGFDALAEDVLGLDAKEARANAIEGALAMGLPCDPLRESLVAAWMRAEAGLLEEGFEGTVTVEPGEKGPGLVVRVTSARVPEALHAIGRRMTPLVRDQQQPQERFERGGREPHEDASGSDGSRGPRRAEEDRPRYGRQGDRPRDDRPRYDGPRQDDRPRYDSPRDDRPHQGGPRGEDRPYQGGPRRDDRPHPGGPRRDDDRPPRPQGGWGRGGKGQR